MSDITMCTGKECPLKETCYRYTAPKNEYRQSYFQFVPYDHESGDCEFYYADQRTKNQLTTRV